MIVIIQQAGKTPLLAFREEPAEVIEGSKTVLHYIWCGGMKTG